MRQSVTSVSDGGRANQPKPEVVVAEVGREEVVAGGGARAGPVVVPLLADRDLTDRCHSLGLRIVPWTVDQPADLALVARAGVDGVVTNYPERARRVADALMGLAAAIPGAT